MLVSIIIPVYNAAQWLGRCLTSINNQTFIDYEVIVVNDGSTDNSQEIIEGFCNINDRIKTITKNNQGVSAARNDGMKIATGDWITFIDSDDYVDNEYIATLVRNADDKYDLIQSGIFFVDENGKTKDKEGLENVSLNLLNGADDFYRQATMPRITGPMAKLYKRRIIEENKIQFDQQLSYGEDRDFNLIYITRCSHTKCISYIGYYYNIGNPNSLSKTKDYYRLLSIDIEYWENLRRSLSRYTISDEITISLANYLFNIYNDRLSEIATKTKLPIYKTICDIFCNNTFNWLRQRTNLINTNFIHRLVFSYGNTIAISLFYNYIRISKR